jgi:hypothetical protein
MTPADLLEGVKKRFNPLLVDKKEELHSLLRKALAAYQDRAGVITSLKLEKSDGLAIAFPDDYLSLVHVTDKDAFLVYSAIQHDGIELEMTGYETWPLRLTYLMNLRDRDFDSWHLPPSIVGMVEDYLEALIKVQNVARIRRVSIDGKFDYSDLPDEPTLHQRVLDLEDRMSYNRAIIPGATLRPF